MEFLCNTKKIINCCVATLVKSQHRGQKKTKHLRSHFIFIITFINNNNNKDNGSAVTTWGRCRRLSPCCFSPQNCVRNLHIIQRLFTWTFCGVVDFWSPQSFSGGWFDWFSLFGLATCLVQVHSISLRLSRFTRSSVHAIKHMIISPTKCSVK